MCGVERRITQQGCGEWHSGELVGPELAGGLPEVSADHGGVP
jgi:hypothetical protein